MSDNQITGIFFLGVLAGAVLVFGITIGISRHTWEKSAIENQAGQYNPVTGLFEWMPKD
jgi:hypothetical protein